MSTATRLTRLEELAHDIPENPHCWDAEGLACFTKLMRWAGASAETIAAGVDLRRRGDWRPPATDIPGETVKDKFARFVAELEAETGGQSEDTDAT